MALLIDRTSALSLLIASDAARVPSIDKKESSITPKTFVTKNRVESSRRIAFKDFNIFNASDFILYK